MSYPPPGGGYAPPGAGYAPPGAGYAPPGAGYAPPGADYPQPPGGPGGYPPPPGAPGSYPPPAGAPGGYPPPAGAPGGYPPAPGGYPTPPAGYPAAQQPAAGYPVAPPYGAAPAAAALYGQDKPKAPPPVVQPVAAAMSQMSLGEQTRGTIRAKHPFDAEADCELLRKAMRGAGTDEKALIDIISTRSNKQRQEVKLRYKTMYGKDLIKDLQSELSSNLEECLVALFVATSLYDAQQLRKAMKGAGTDETTLIEILCTRTNQEVRAIKEEYKTYYKRDLEKDCVSETSGHFKRLLVSMCQANRDETTHVDMAKAQKEANDLFKAGEKKWGTDESRFNVVLASRSIPQLRATFDEYVKISQRDILNSIDREMSGDIKDGFKAVVLSVRDRPVFFAERLWKSMKGAGTDDNMLIRIIVSRSEIDLADIKTAFLRLYHKTVYKMVEGDCSGDYKKLLMGIIGKDI